MNHRMPEENPFAAPEGFSGVIGGLGDPIMRYVTYDPAEVGAMPATAPLELTGPDTIPSRAHIARNQFVPNLPRFQDDDAYAVALNEAVMNESMDYAERKHQGRLHYTEVHQVGRHFMILPDVRSSQRHAASLTGHHSMLDGGDVTPAEMTTVVGAQEVIRQSFGLSTDTLRAKGTLAKQASGALDLQIHHMYRGSATQPYEWLYALKAQTDQQPMCTVEHKVDVHTRSFEVPQFIPAGEIIADRVVTPNDHPGGASISGFLDGMKEHEVARGQVRMNGRGEYVRSGDLKLTGKEAWTGRHLELYQAAGYHPGLHFFDVHYDGYNQTLACQYTERLDENSTNVAVVYKGADESALRFNELRALLVNAFQFNHRGEQETHELQFHETFTDQSGHAVQTVSSVIVGGKVVSTQTRQW